MNWLLHLTVWSLFLSECIMLYFVSDMNWLLHLTAWSLFLSSVFTRKNYNYHTYSPYYQYSKFRTIRAVRQMNDDAMMGDQADSGFVNKYISNIFLISLSYTLLLLFVISLTVVLIV